VRPEKLYRRALAIKEQIFGQNHLEAGITLNNLGLYYKSVGRLAEARQAYLRALPIFQSAFGGSHPQVGGLLYNLGLLLAKEAETFLARAETIGRDAEEMADPSWREKVVINHAMSRFDLRVAPSRIHRFGVFAGQDIPAGAKIIQYSGQLVSRREWVKRSMERSYLLRVSKYWCVDGAVGGSGAQWINHCCEPNCRFTGTNPTWAASLRPIKNGEELLLDYQFPKDYRLIPCYCGAATCRGTINAR